MSNRPGGEWKNTAYKDDPPPPMSRERAQSEIDFLYGTGKIDRVYWSNAYENLSRLVCKDYRRVISPDLCLTAHGTSAPLKS